MLCSCKLLTSEITPLLVCLRNLIFWLFAFSLIRTPSAYLPIFSPLTSPLPFTSWTKSPLPFHCICLLAIIITAVSHHRCSAVFTPTLLPNSPQSLLIVLYLHNLSALCLSFHSFLSCSDSSHRFYMGKTEIYLNRNACHVTDKNNWNIWQVFSDWNGPTVVIWIDPFNVCLLPGAQSVWGTFVFCGPAPEDYQRQGRGERLSAMRL